MVQIFNEKTKTWNDFHDEHQLYCYINSIFRMHDMSIKQISEWIENLDETCKEWDDSDYYAFENFDSEDEETLQELKDGALFSYRNNSLDLVSDIIELLTNRLAYFVTKQKELSI
jgi:hypothetical protein